MPGCRFSASAPRLPVILPVVLAQNDRRWDIAESFRALFDVPDGAEPFLPDFTFRLIQLAEIPFDKIVGSPDGIFILRTLKADAAGQLLGDPVWEDALLKRVSTTLFEHILRYLLARDIDKANLLDRLKAVRQPNLRQHAMTVAQQLRQEGRQEAILRLLEIRHQHVPEGLAETIREVTDDAVLDRLLHAAATSPDIEAFTAAL